MAFADLRSVLDFMLGTVNIGAIRADG